MELAIDTASDESGIALSVDGVAGLTAVWTTQQNHSVEVLPSIERLLAEAGRTKADVTAVFVDIGPGSYAGLRVGVSVAKVLAHALAVPIVGAGRLELEAYGVAAHAAGRRIVAVHRAGRGELARAAYASDGDAWREVEPPGMLKRDALAATIARGDVLTGDIDDELERAAQGAGATVASADRHRVIALAALGHRRLASGSADDPGTLVPVYLRGPAIGPQESRPRG
jgi:tRNA threonylcarbamoyladenosine biosynthesis protein TsaB